MSNDMVSPNAHAVRDAAGGTFYGLMYLAFATLAYTDQASKKIVNVSVDLHKDVAALPPPPIAGGGSISGQWSVDWGPGIFNVDQNLMYIASFREAGSMNPVITVLSIRGTDIFAAPAAILGQVFQDTADWLRVKWSRASSDAAHPCEPEINPFDESPKIASGTCHGLKRLRAMMQVPSGGTSAMPAEQYLETLLQDDPDLPIVVTGHSLGGCQTTVMAMHLADVLPSGTRVLANPYAAPTAGNAGFAALYDQRFGNGNGNVWWNTLDLVPNAFARGSETTPGNLSWAEGLWQDHGGPRDEVMHTLIARLQNTLPRYQQPAAGAVTLVGSVATPDFIARWLGDLPNPPRPDSWTAQMLWQHFPPNHYELIEQQIPSVAPYPYPGKLPE